MIIDKSKNFDEEAFLKEYEKQLEEVNNTTNKSIKPMNILSLYKMITNNVLQYAIKKIDKLEKVDLSNGVLRNKDKSLLTYYENINDDFESEDIYIQPYLYKKYSHYFDSIGWGIKGLSKVIRCMSKYLFIYLYINNTMSFPRIGKLGIIKYRNRYLTSNKNILDNNFRLIFRPAKAHKGDKNKERRFLLKNWRLKPGHQAKLVALFFVIKTMFSPQQLEEIENS